MGLITSWSPTRLSDYEKCPRYAKLKHVDKLCPRCFKGRLYGGFGTPVVCDACSQEIAMPAALARGSEIGENLELYVKGKTGTLHPEIRHPKVKQIAKDFRLEFKKKRVMVEHQIVLDDKWNPVSKFTKGAWFRGKLDVLKIVKNVAKVTDWKSGGIDKRTGAVKLETPGKYDDQLSIYAVITLVAFPMIEKVEADLVFTDCGPAHEPVVARAGCNLARPKLELAKRAWERRVLPMFKDDVFAPKCNPGCAYCDYSKGKGGPCKF